MNGEARACFLLPPAEAAVTPRPMQTKRLARSVERIVLSTALHTPFMILQMPSRMTFLSAICLA